MALFLSPKLADNRGIVSGGYRDYAWLRILIAVSSWGIDSCFFRHETAEIANP